MDILGFLLKMLIWPVYGINYLLNGHKVELGYIALLFAGGTFALWPILGILRGQDFLSVFQDFALYYVAGVAFWLLARKIEGVKIF